jgi:hypothetical protein
VPRDWPALHQSRDAKVLGYVSGADAISHDRAKARLCARERWGGAGYLELGETETGWQSKTNKISHTRGEMTRVASPLFELCALDGFAFYGPGFVIGVRAKRWKMPRCADWARRGALHMQPR